MRPSIRNTARSASNGSRTPAPLTIEAHGDGRDEITDAAETFIRTGRRRRERPSSSGGTPAACTSGRTSRRRRKGSPGLGIYPDGMVEHDAHVGGMLDLLDELGVTDNTIVMYSTDNGAEEMTWPDGGTTPFRGEKDTTWEGGFRVPCLFRWPGVIAPGTVSNAIGSHEDCLPTFLAAAGQPDITEQLLRGLEVGDMTYQGAPRRVQLHAVLGGRGRSRRRGRSSSTGPMTATWRRCASITGRSTSSSSAPKGSTSGRSRSCRCACRS